MYIHQSSHSTALLKALRSKDWLTETFILSHYQRGRSSNTAVEHMPCNLEVMGSYPAGNWTFFLLLYISFPTFIYQWRVLNQAPQRGASLTLAVALTSLNLGAI